MARCVVCEKLTSGSLEFCKVHYRLHKKDIEDKKPWVKELKNDAQRQRRLREKEFNNTSLDQMMDRQYEKQY
jgi:hypothetical protein